MMRRISIVTAAVTAEAELLETPTAAAIWEALPFESAVQTWGEEIYFGIPLSIEEEKDARRDVQVGDLGYWPVGEAFCIFFGQTPASKGPEPRAASPVNVFGRVIGDAQALRKARDGDRVRVDRVES
jgi:hypothetical protein